MTGVVVGAVSLFLLSAMALTAVSQAVFQVSPSRVRTLTEEGFSGAQALARLRADDRAVRTGLRFVATLLALAAMGIAVTAGTEAWGVVWSPATVALMALAVFVLADAIPRGIAARHPVRIALASAPALVSASRVLAALALPFTILEGSRPRNGFEGSAEERELRELQEIGKEEGVLEADENLLVERAFRLDELTAWDVMTPRVDIFAWKESTPLAQILPELPKVPYSRVPVYRDTVDDITGIVYVREAYQASIEGGGQRTLGSIAREPFFVPGSLSLAKLLQDFQNRRIHMGIVADEFGGTDGLVTLEDVLEELVGEIVDETDLDEQAIIRVGSDQVIVDAAEDLRDINHALDVALPHNDHRSLNGFILEELGYVPSNGERMERNGVEMEILEATETQVLRARLRRLPGPDPASDEE